MAPTNSLWIVPSLQRYRPIIFALTALAAGCTIYYVHDSLWNAEATPKFGGSLQRSNARRRRRRARSTGPPPDSHQAGEEQQPSGGTQVELQALDGAETETDGASDHSYEEEGGKEDESKDGQRLLVLLYKIAEEQARKDGYVHRGVQCNSCSENPIKGIRYRCVNCADYDLCEACESLQIHPKTHLFYKIRIPAPFLGAHKERQPVFYPGRPRAVNQDLQKEKLDRYCRETGYKVEEIEAFWEQFRCMAATEWTADPDHYHLAIDRRTFDECFIPNTSLRPPAPNLIYDRIFSFYDTNNDGLIGFAEFVGGLASLKRKNASERLRRLFNGYDLDSDGYIDRRDFLRMFRAYYALTKELTSEIVAGMQDAEDEGDARELVTGGQPLSSAFTGSIPRGDRRAPRTGKILNDFGDDVVVHGMGAVDEEEFDASAELRMLIADNTEAVRWSGPTSGTSGHMIYEFTVHAPWHLVFETMRERQPATVEPEEEDEKKALRHRLRIKLATESLHRRINRRLAIIHRARRQSFFQDNHKPHSSINVPREVDGMLVDPRLHTRLGKDLMEILRFSKKSDHFHSFVTDMIQGLDWPVESTEKLKRSILHMVELGWSERALIQDLDSFSRDGEAVETFVKAFTGFLSQMATETRQEPGFKRELRKISVPGRSRSSSKVRFEDSLGDDDDDESRSATSISSRSRPLNERWGGFETPEPETDVGREILYQVTQEALNELLEPVFKLREDFALQALLTKKRRSKYRAKIIAAVASDVDLRNVETYLEWYPRRWRKQNVRPPRLDMEQFDESAFFSFFVRFMLDDLENNLTGGKCAECAKAGKDSFVRIGCQCLQHNYHRPNFTPARPMEFGPSPSPETCKHCAQKGKESWVHVYCSECGEPGERLLSGLSRIRRIIVSGGETVPPEDAEAGVQSSTRADVDRAERFQMPVKDKHPRAEGPFDDGAPKAEPQHGTPEQPKDGSAQRESTAEPKQASDDYSDSESYPEMAVDLHSSVAAFNDFDASALEANIASKPLEELLVESGYASASAQPSRQPTPPTPSLPDPTLPQNRPNSVDTPPRSSPSPSAPPTLDTTPPQDATNSINATLIPPIPSAGSNPPFTDPHQSPRILLDKIMKGDPDQATCKYFAALDIIEAEDKERGGPGRLNFEEFEEVMNGEKGQALAFLANWVEIGAF